MTKNRRRGACSRQVVEPQVVMQQWLELAALAVAFIGWFCTILTHSLALWTVSGTLDNSTATLPAYWDGVWLEWDQWDLGHDGSLRCSFYRALMLLSGSFRTWRSLIKAAIAFGGLAVLVGAAGVMWVPARRWIQVASGALSVLAGLLLLIATAWTCHHTSQPLEGAVLLRRDWGPALYLGWTAVALLLAAGVFIATTARHVKPPDAARSPDQELDASHPLNRINRAAFTNSQYERGDGTV